MKPVVDPVATGRPSGCGPMLEQDAVVFVYDGHLGAAGRSMIDVRPYLDTMSHDR